MGVNLLLEQRIQPALISLILLLLAGLPAFLAGFLDDVTKVMKVMDRLLLTAVSAVLSIAVLGAVVPRIDISALDVYFQFSLVAIFFTVVAVVGVSNAMNIIDGYHGLASGVGLIITLAFATISYVHSDAFLLITCLALLGALLGFLIWNWPKGYLFLGDGGAYLLGFILAQVGILLVIRHPDISPWFPLTLIIYPVFETLFSIVRRLGKNHSPGHADNLHLHQLVFRYEQDCHREKGLQYHNGLCNPKVAKYFWIATLLNASIAMPWSGHTPVMMVLVGINALGYVLTYRWLSKRYLAQSN
jgi:UDP-N-acetylmuramyl pentapeptide phosphotransferase/UDP-N-acetylglucosamine-1-phosphate transferase